MRNSSFLAKRGMATVAALAVLALCGTASQVQAKPAPQVVQLAHTAVTQAQGSHALLQVEGSAYDFRHYTPAQAGDAITFSVTVLKSGVYRLQTTSYKDGAEGIYKLEVDGVEVGQKDFYESNVWDHGEFDIEVGTYLITYRYVGKNAASNGTGVKLGTLHFR